MRGPALARRAWGAWGAGRKRGPVCDATSLRAQIVAAVAETTASVDDRQRNIPAPVKDGTSDLGGSLDVDANAWLNQLPLVAPEEVPRPIIVISRGERFHAAEAAELIPGIVKLSALAATLAELFPRHIVHCI
mmetsp:Transcript_26729/g.78957  ORF Transcript_26729/g.78957 Transcript_26729/m.78957 type:complete len:133 (+) Transcript_26729:335-733(+)